MKIDGIRRLFGRLGAAALLYALAAPAALWGQFECKQELMAGTWVSHAELWILEREAPDPFPPPGPFSTTGNFVFDSQGRALAARQTNSTSMGVSRPNFATAFDSHATINADCTGTITQALRTDLPAEHPLISVFGLDPGQLVFELDTVCSNGQRECRATFTAPAGVLIGIVKLERIDPPAVLTTADVAGELASIKANIAALSRRLGIVPVE